MAKNLLQGKTLAAPSLIEAEGPPQEGTGNNRTLPLDQIFDSPLNPYNVEDNGEMAELTASIKANGLLMPLIVRPRKEGGYELVSGHRRAFAMRKAGLTEARAELIELDDSHVKLTMGQYNKYRTVTPRERARDYQQQMDGFRELLESGEITGRADFAIAEMNGVNHSTIQNYLRLNYLIEPLGDLVDDNKLKVTPAIQLSYLTPKEQEIVEDQINMTDKTPSLHQAVLMKGLSQEQKLTEKIIEQIFSGEYQEEKPLPPKVELPAVFPPPEPPEQPKPLPPVMQPAPAVPVEPYKSEIVPPVTPDVPDSQQSEQEPEEPQQQTNFSPPTEPPIQPASPETPETPATKDNEPGEPQPVREQEKSPAEQEESTPPAVQPAPVVPSVSETTTVVEPPISQEPPATPIPAQIMQEQEYIQIPIRDIRRYFRKDASPEQMAEHIFQLLRVESIKQRGGQSR